MAFALKQRNSLLTSLYNYDIIPEIMFRILHLPFFCYLLYWPAIYLKQDLEIREKYSWEFYPL